MSYSILSIGSRCFGSKNWWYDYCASTRIARGSITIVSVPSNYIILIASNLCLFSSDTTTIIGVSTLIAGEYDYRCEYAYCGGVRVLCEYDYCGASTIIGGEHAAWDPLL